jgi:TrkA domain protein
MAEIQEIHLPGVGVRLEFSTQAGEQVAVIVHKGGRRELAVYDDMDRPDSCSTVLHLTPDETRTLGEMLGGSTVNEVTSHVVHDIEGLAIDWLTVEPDSPFVSQSIGQGMFRTNTGVSIVAVIRQSETVPSPGPEFVFEAGDVAVAVGTPGGIDQVRELLGH